MILGTPATSWPIPCYKGINHPNSNSIGGKALQEMSHQRKCVGRHAPVLARKLVTVGTPVKMKKGIGPIARPTVRECIPRLVRPGLSVVFPAPRQVKRRSGAAKWSGEVKRRSGAAKWSGEVERRSGAAKWSGEVERRSGAAKWSGLLA